MFIVMKVVDKNRVQIRVRIEGSFQGKPWVYEDPIDSDGSQFIWLDAETEDEKNSAFWWREGNMCCDCNRHTFMSNTEMDFGECGHEIKIHKIIPLEGDFTTLLVDGYEDQW